jgi:hypothetical protein
VYDIDINYVVHEEFIDFNEIHVLNAKDLSRSILESINLNHPIVICKINK